MSNPTRRSESFILTQGSWTDLRIPALTVRAEVFQKEQEIAATYDEDGLDPECIHILISTKDGVPLGTSRLNQNQLGRLAVVPEARRRGLGFLLVSAMLRAAFMKDIPYVWANAQPGALGLARLFGFTIDPGVFYLADRPHYRVHKEIISTYSTSGTEL